MANDSRSWFGTIAAVSLLTVLFIASLIAAAFWSYRQPIKLPPMPKSEPEWGDSLEPGDIIVDPGEIKPESPSN